MSRHRRFAAGGLLLAYAGFAARFSGPTGAREQSVFARIKQRGDHPLLRVPQQRGTPWTLPLVAAAAAAGGRRRDALTALACLPVVKGVEVATKSWRPRPRPVHTQPTELRDDAPVEGGSMPSGHAALAACGTTLLLPHVPPPARAALVGPTALSAWVRVHQGAHQPSDAVAGLVLGTGVALAADELAGAVSTRPAHLLRPL